MNARFDRPIVLRLLNGVTDWRTEFLYRTPIVKEMPVL